MIVAGSPAAPLPPSPRDEKAQATAKAFEAVMMGQMTALMLESAQPAGEFSGGHGEQMFRGVLAEKIGTAIAEQGRMGVAQAVMKQILLLQGASNSGE